MNDVETARERFELARTLLAFRREALRKATEEYERAAYALLDAIEPEPAELRRAG